MHIYIYTHTYIHSYIYIWLPKLRESISTAAFE